METFVHFPFKQVDALINAVAAAWLDEIARGSGSGALFCVALSGGRIAGRLFSEFSLQAGNAAMMHLSAKGYLSNNAAQRRLREAYFIAIVTPAIKHLRKELHEFDSHACTRAQDEREVA